MHYVPYSPFPTSLREECWKDDPHHQSNSQLLHFSYCHISKDSVTQFILFHVDFNIVREHTLPYPTHDIGFANLTSSNSILSELEERCSSIIRDIFLYNITLSTFLHTANIQIIREKVRFPIILFLKKVRFPMKR